MNAETLLGSSNGGGGGSSLVILAGVIFDKFIIMNVVTFIAVFLIVYILFKFFMLHIFSFSELLVNFVCTR